MWISFPNRSILCQNFWCPSALWCAFFFFLYTELVSPVLDQVFAMQLMDNHMAPAGLVPRWVSWIQLLHEVKKQPDNVTVLVTHGHFVWLLTERQHLFDEVPSPRINEGRSDRGPWLPFSPVSLQGVLWCGWPGVRSWGTGRVQWEEIKILTPPEQSCCYRATGSLGDVFVPTSLEVDASLAPSGHSAGDFFIFLLCSKLHWLLFYFRIFLLLALFWLSVLCVYLYRPAKTRPCTTSSSSSALWYSLWTAPFGGLFPFTVEHPLAGRNRRKRSWLGPCLSLSTVIFICSSYFYFPSWNPQCGFENSCGLFLKFLIWIKENYLFWKAVRVNYFP